MPSSTGREPAASPGADQLFPLLYEELRKLAASQLARLRVDGTLQPTALVHEAFLKLAGREELSWEERRHFFATAAQAMRELVIDHARRKRAQKRGGGQAPEELEKAALDIEAIDVGADDVLALHDALSSLEEQHPRKAQVALLRHFGGMTTQEIAELHGVATRTVEREWRFARAWLHSRLADPPQAGG